MNNQISATLPVRLTCGLFCLLITMLQALPSHAADPMVADVDLQITNLTLTPGDQTNFMYSFTVKNNSATAVSGYSLKLTFSQDQDLSQSDYFNIVIPANKLGGQFVGANQSLLKNEHFIANNDLTYLLSGTWYVFAEINFDRTLSETNYDNNVTMSTNTITVPPYQLNFTVAPQVLDITDSSFTLKATLDTKINKFYFLYKPKGAPAPTVDDLRIGNELFAWQPQVIVSDLGPSYSFDVYCLGERYDGNITAIVKLEVTTLGSAVPTVHISKTSINLQPIAVNTESAPEVFMVSGFHLTTDVTITPSANVLVSKDGTTWSGQLTYPVSVFTSSPSQRIYVKTSAFTSTGVKNEVVTAASPGAESKGVAVRLSVFNPSSSTFDDVTSLAEIGWMTYNVSGIHLWALVDLSTTSVDQRTAASNMAMQINGAEDGVTSDEDWLISPAIDVSAFKFYPTLHYKTYSSGEGDPLSLVYSANYSGNGDPRLATWFSADGAFPAVGSEVWHTSTVQIESNQNRLHFAFVYKSSIEVASKWTLDDWSVTDNLTYISDELLTFENIEVGTHSESQSMSVELAGYGDVKVEASKGFKVSTDNITFYQSLDLAEGEVLNGMTIFVVFAPTSVESELQGTITFSGPGASFSRSNIVGSSMLTLATEKAIASSFIYPNPTDGTVHVSFSDIEDHGGPIPVQIFSSLGLSVGSFEANTSGLEAKLSDVVTGLAPGVYIVTLKSSNVTYRNKLIRR